MKSIELGLISIVGKINLHIDGRVQERHDSIANALVLLALIHRCPPYVIYIMIRMVMDTGQYNDEHKTDIKEIETAYRPLGAFY